MASNKIACKLLLEAQYPKNIGGGGVSSKGFFNLETTKILGNILFLREKILVLKNISLVSNY